MKRFFFVIALLLQVIIVEAEKIACVGNSITFGAFIQNREQNSYPAQLQVYLGNEYVVGNFGVSGTTVLSDGDRPYVKTKEFAKSLEFQPDVVILKLGTNDTKPQNWRFKEHFKEDYLNLVRAYRDLPSKPRIILLTPLRSFLEKGAAINDSIIQEGVTPIIEEIASEENLEIINMHTMFGDRWISHLLPDRLHPSSIGAGMVAKKIDEYLAIPNASKASDVVSTFSLNPIKKFNFHGFHGYEYSNEGVKYYIVQPHRPAVGNPWIWRARFWGHEPQTDIDLLERGFYLTYCDVADLYGSDKAVERWNHFYKLAVKAGLNKKVVLEGMSRGGLIVYNWAATNPKKVACIYADAPVLDIKSWPMGKGGSDGSADDTKKMLAAYGFKDEAQALLWMKNPVDHAAILAKAGIPILHVVGDADVVVPVDENTAVLEKRLAEKGAKLSVIHKPGIGHHPHSLYNPSLIVDFILRATGGCVENWCVHPVVGNEFRSAAGWVEGSDWHTVAKDIEETLAGKRIKVLLLGNSITQGFGGTRKAVVYKPGKEAMDAAIGIGSWESAGISGDKTQNLLWRIKEGDYNRCHPEVVCITIGVNNVLAGDTSAEIAKGIEACAVEACKQFPESRIVLFGLLPAGKSADDERRMACNDIHKLLARTRMERVEYIDPTSWFVNADGSLKAELYGADCIHLTSEGYKTWSAEIACILSGKK